MRLTLLPLLAISSFLVCAVHLTAAETEIAMQVCTPISTGDCAAAPYLLKPPAIKFSKRPAPPEGVVGMNLIVGSDGSVRDIEVVKSPNEELTKEITASAKNWNFAPATFQGRNAAVKIRVLLQFPAVGEPIVMIRPWRSSWADPAELQKLFVEANQALGRRDYQQAVALSRQLLALEPLYQRIRLALGASLVELRQYDEAEAVLQEEIKLEPKSPFAYNTLGWAYQRHYKYDEAITEFKKQIEITPEAFDPHANLGVLLCSRKRCGEAVPELEKSLALSPGQSRTLLSEGECDIDLGNTDKGISEMEQAASKAAASGSWDEAAYRLAEDDVELDKALKWSQMAITIDSAYLQNLSLDHATPTQMSKVNTLTNYWDTLGWVYFRMGSNDRALSYVDAAWRMHPTPTKGDHLGEIYEKLGRREDAIHAYAMAVVSAGLSKRGASSPEDLAEARNRLTKLLGQGADVAALIERGRPDLDALRSVTVENPAKRVGSADFIIKVVGNTTMDVRQIAGDATFAPFSEVLRKSPLPLHIPAESEVEILRRGTLSCIEEATDCRFTLLGTEDAAEIATREADTAKAISKF
jgi:tetratricopeptide (TPR) repeat protein